MASNNIPHPEEAATAAVSKGLPRRRPGDAPAPLPPSLACPPAKARGLDPRGGTHGPDPAATAPASCASHRHQDSPGDLNARQDKHRPHGTWRHQTLAR